MSWSQPQTRFVSGLIEPGDTTMHKHFADWHRLADIELDAVNSPKRWKAMEDFGPGRAEIIVLTRYRA
jgi:hypothetical protein